MKNKITSLTSIPRKLGISAPYFSTLLILLIGGLFARLFYLEDFTFDKFIDRDLFRALNPDPFFWAGGSDISGGGKTPGGFLNIFLRILHTAAFGEIDLVYLYYTVLQMTGYSYLAWQIGKLLKPSIGLLFLSLILVNYVALEQFNILWNPTLASPFFCFALGFILNLCLRKKSIYFPLTVLFISIASHMHVSNLLLFPLLAFAILITRTRVARMAYAAGALLFAIMYLPYFWMVASQPVSIANVRMSPFLNPVFYFRQFFEVLGNLAGVYFPYEGNQGVQWTYRSRLSDWGPLRYVVPLFSILPVLFALAGYRKADKRSEGIRFALKLTLFALATFVIVLVVSFSNLELNLRRYIWAQPLVILALAIGIDQARVRFAGSGKKILSAILMGSLVAASASQIFFFSKSMDERVNFNSFYFKQEVVDVAMNVFGFNPRQLRKNVGLITRDDYAVNPDKYYINTIAEDDGTGVMSLLSGLPPGQTAEVDECLMVIKDENDIEYKSSHFSLSGLNEFLTRVDMAPPFQIKKIHLGELGVYFTYEKIEENCLNFFENYYYIEEKLELKEALKGRSAGEVVSRFDPQSGRQNFYVYQSFNFDPHYFRLSLKLDEGLAGSVYQDTMEHRGAEEQTYFQLHDLHSKSEIVLTDSKNGNVIVIPIYRNGALHPSLTPTNFHFKKELPPPGQYSLSLRVYPHQERPMTIPITDNLEIQGSEIKLKGR